MVNTLSSPLSIYFSIPPVSLREKTAKISLFQYFDLQNEGKIRCRRRGNEEWGVIKGTSPHSARVITLFRRKEAENTVVIVVQEQLTLNFIFTNI